jgi:hypothetical protein
MLGLNSSHGAGQKELLEPFVTKALDHDS